MAYELSILRVDGGGAALEGLAQALAGEGTLERRGEDEASWRLGETGIRLRVTATGTVEASIPFGALEEEADAAIGRLLQACDGLGLAVFDPQLGRPVSPSDASAVGDRFEAVSRWHVELAGASEDGRQGLVSAQDAFATTRPRLSLQVKIAFVLAGIVVLAWLGLRAFVVRPMMDEIAPVGEPIPGPPPGWLAAHPPVERDADAAPRPDARP